MTNLILRFPATNIKVDFELMLPTLPEFWTNINFQLNQSTAFL